MNDELISILPRLRRFAISLTGDRADGDDLLHKLVERLLARGVPEDVNLLKWSFRICRNIWIDEIRSRRVRSQVAFDDVSHQVRGVDGEASAMARLTLREVNVALETLPEEQRIALILVAVEGFSYAETAENLNVPVGTVMSRVARARKALTVLFENDPLGARGGGDHGLH